MASEAVVKPFRVSLGICTRNRPADLKRAIDAALASSFSLCEILVSDDSTDTLAKELIATEFGSNKIVKYLEGPRKGLGANRNCLLDKVTGTHIIFIDDDVLLARDFIEKIIRCREMATHTYKLPDNRIISTGLENKNGKIVSPHSLSFMGFQTKPYESHDEIESIVINATLFPSELFDVVRFDPLLVYGSEEIDLSGRAVNSGFKIVICKDAINFHNPSPINRDFYQKFIDASRIYATFKKYFYVEKKRFTAVVFLALAMIHIFLHNLKKNRLRGIKTGLQTIGLVVGYLASPKK